MSRRKPVAVGLRTLAASLVLLGWLVVLRGLYFLTPSSRPELDLEAGPSFAVNLAVYLPSMALTVVLLVLLPVAVTATRVGAATVTAAAGITGAFGLWVLTQDALLDYLPGLSGHLWGGVALSGTALVVGCAAHAGERFMAVSARP
jgi:hypothetical protein